TAQPERRPGPAVALPGDAPPADLLAGHAGPTVRGLIRPAERGLRDGAVAVLMLLVAEAEFGTPHVGVQQVGLQLELQAGLFRVFREEAAADVLGAAHLRQQVGR